MGRTLYSVSHNCNTVARGHIAEIKNIFFAVKFDIVGFGRYKKEKQSVEIYNSL